MLHFKMWIPDVLKFFLADNIHYRHFPWHGDLHQWVGLEWKRTAVKWWGTQMSSSSLCGLEIACYGIQLLVSTICHHTSMKTWKTSSQMSWHIWNPNKTSGSHTSAEDSTLPGHYAMSNGKLLPTFRTRFLPPSSGSFLTSPTIYQLTQNHIPENVNLHLWYLFHFNETNKTKQGTKYELLSITAC
jgi:hypothetical protein